jgi:hypothetical protein
VVLKDAINEKLHKIRCRHFFDTWDKVGSAGKSITNNKDRVIFEGFGELYNEIHRDRLPRMLGDVERLE